MIDKEVRETVYENEHGKDTFTITAAERWSIGMVRRLKEKFPDEVEITGENPDGTITAKMPRSWMRISPKRKIHLTDEQAHAAAERLKAARARRAPTEKENEKRKVTFNRRSPFLRFQRFYAFVPDKPLHGHEAVRWSSSSLWKL